MATSWQVAGEYLETCSCDFLCPCLPSNMADPPTKGACTFAMVFRVGSGRYGAVSLDGLAFAVVGHTPGRMADGNWSVGVITDERGSAEQREALAAIASGQAGGPMAALGGLVTRMLGVEARPIRFHRDGPRGSASIPGVLDQALEGVPSPSKPGELLHIDDTLHPANSRLALARATRSHLSVFGLRWDDESGRNNGHLAPFSWRS
jgi:hypothetical protein